MPGGFEGFFVELGSGEDLVAVDEDAGDAEGTLPVGRGGGHLGHALALVLFQPGTEVGDYDVLPPETQHLEYQTVAHGAKTQPVLGHAALLGRQALEPAGQEHGHDGNAHGLVVYVEPGIDTLLAQVVQNPVQLVLGLERAGAHENGMGVLELEARALGNLHQLIERTQIVPQLHLPVRQGLVFVDVDSLSAVCRYLLRHQPAQRKLGCSARHQQ